MRACGRSVRALPCHPAASATSSSKRNRAYLLGLRMTSSQYNLGNGSVLDETERVLSLNPSFLFWGERGPGVAAGRRGCGPALQRERP